MTRMRRDLSSGWRGGWPATGFAAETDRRGHSPRQHGRPGSVQRTWAVRHQDAAPLEQVRAPVGRLHATHKATIAAVALSCLTFRNVSRRTTSEGARRPHGIPDPHWPRSGPRPRRRLPPDAMLPRPRPARSRRQAQGEAAKATTRRVGRARGTRAKRSIVRGGQKRKHRCGAVARFGRWHNRSR